MNESPVALGTQKIDCLCVVIPPNMVTLGFDLSPYIYVCVCMDTLSETWDTHGGVLKSWGFPRHHGFQY